MNVSGFTRQTLIMRNCTSWNMILSGFITVGSRRFQSLYNSIIDVYTHRFLIGIRIHCDAYIYISNQDTIVTDESVLNSEVSSFQRLLSTQMWHLRQMKVS